MDGAELLRSVVALDDPLGVLSIYVGVHPEQEAGSPPAWELEVRRGLEDRRASLAAAGDERGHALARRLGEIRVQLDQLLSPRASGRGRALFTGLSGGEPIIFANVRPFPTLVSLSERAVVRPLALVIQEGRPAGIALASEEVRVYELALGEAVELRMFPVVEEGDRRELRGPSASVPRGSVEAGPGFRSGQQRDLFEHRVEDRRERLLSHLGKEIAELALSRRWDDVVVGGGERSRGALLHGLAEHGLEATLDPRDLGSLAPADLAKAVAPALDERRSARALGELERVRELALSGGRGALGLADTLAMLGEGRVEHLLLPAERELEGLIAPDGTLFPAGVTPPGTAAAELRPESQLAERMLRRALDTDAHVTLLAGETEAALGPDDAAALLRW